MTANQGRMVLSIAAAYGEELTLDRARELLGVLAAGLGFRALTRQVVKLIPFGGWAASAAMGYAGTVALGRAAVLYFDRAPRRSASGRWRTYAPGRRGGPRLRGPLAPLQEEPLGAREVRGVARSVWRTLVEARHLVLRLVVALAALQAAVVGVLVALAQLRKRRQAPPEGFPWEEQPEIELEAGGDRLKLFPYGVRLYEEMLEEIRSARERIYVGTFIWKGDETGRRFVEALAERARAGVEVCVIFDGLANVVVPPSFKRFPEEIHTLHFRPLWGPRHLANPRNIFRYHRHLMSVDGRCAFLGGYNIGSLYADGWRDTHVRVRGLAAREVENDFMDFWNWHRTPGLPRLMGGRERSWNPYLVFHRNDPYLRIFPIRAMYLEAIDRANRHIYLTHAYFVPDRAMRKGLVEAAKRGVDVQVLLPEESNHITADWLARRHFYELLSGGVRIFRYRHIMIHSKTATVDGVWSTIGSANIDRLSLLGNYEINLEVYSRRLAGQMERMFELDRTNAVELTLEEWTNRPLFGKVVERLLASLRPLV